MAGRLGCGLWARPAIVCGGPQKNLILPCYCFTHLKSLAEVTLDLFLEGLLEQVPDQLCEWPTPCLLLHLERIEEDISLKCC